ncbi:hypothetical protein APHAL10511_006376 [Amanita phalloides]|nr:hypothetical protein APHAL10511_006376 [Amanita phalloides]
MFSLPLIARITRHRLSPRLLHSRPSLPASCPSCHSPLPSSLPACTNCWTISALPSDVTHHQLFGLPYEPNPFSVSVPLLRKRFLLAQTICHPDAWSCKGPHKQDVAQALSARLNGAYQNLLNPLSRAEYILELNQLPMSEADQVNDMAFMSHIMDAREMIEESENKDEIMTLAEDNDARIKGTVAEIERLAGERDWIGVKEAAIRLRYLEGVRRAVNAWLDNH